MSLSKGEWSSTFILQHNQLILSVPSDILLNAAKCFSESLVNSSQIASPACVKQM